MCALMELLPLLLLAAELVLVVKTTMAFRRLASRPWPSRMTPSCTPRSSSSCTCGDQGHANTIEL